MMLCIAFYNVSLFIIDFDFSCLFSFGQLGLNDEIGMLVFMFVIIFSLNKFWKNL